MFDDRSAHDSRSTPAGSDARGALSSAPIRRDDAAVSDPRLSDLAALSALPIEMTLAHDLSAALHDAFDHVSDHTLPIYFGPLLGRLYLEGL